MNPNNTAPNRKALRLPAVLEKTGISRSHLYRLMAQDRFPHSILLSERVSAWDQTAIDEWLAKKFAEVKS